MTPPPPDLVDWERQRAFLAVLADGSLSAASRALGVAQPTVRRDDFAFRTDSDLGQLAAIRAAIGVGVCQTGLATRSPGLVRVLADAFAFDLDVWVVMHEDVRTVRRMRLVYDALVAGLADYARLP